MKKVLIAVLLIIIWVLLTACSLMLWNGNGTIIDIAKGQFQSGVNLPDRGVASHTSTEKLHVAMVVPDGRVLFTVDPAFLSFSLDTAQVTGGLWWSHNSDNIETNSGSEKQIPFDFNRSQLDKLVQALAPARLRIGGSEADRVHYEIAEKVSVNGGREVLPEGFASVLTREQWDAANAFALRNGLSIVFTLNAGSGPRRNGQWNIDEASALIEYSTEKKYPVEVWEFGNELNGFWFLHGLGAQISPKTYAENLRMIRLLMEETHSPAKLAGQGSAFWPVFGELGSIFAGFMPQYLEAGGNPDIVMWHYYPQQSRRAPFASRRANPTRLLDPENLDEVAFWARKVRDSAKKWLPDSKVWLGETGNAQFGGEPGVSDRYIAGLWWLDELGLMAKTGMSAVVRQTLVGMDYGMIDEQTLKPRPDYWNSLLWKRLMGNLVFDAQIGLDTGQSKDLNKRLRVYLHSAGPGTTNSKYCALFINLNTTSGVRIQLPASQEARRVWYLSTPDILGSEVLLNGIPLQLDGNGNIPQLLGDEMSSEVLELNPLSYVFVTW